MEWLLWAGGAWLFWKLFLADRGQNRSRPFVPSERAIPKTKPALNTQSFTKPSPPLAKPIVQKKVLPDIDLSDESRMALKAIDEGRNVFISGAAGTGKSTFLDYLQKYIDGDKNSVVLAPTGVAALNVGGQTIHSFFKFKTHILTEDDINSLANKRPYRAIDLIIIDEISMVRADIFDSINRFMKKNGKDPKKPFGGAQVLLLGDLFQLPPVLTNDDKEFFSQLYDTPFFFNTSAFLHGGFECIEFKKVYRQSDRDFVDMLNRIRVGDVDKALLEQINARCVRNFPKETVLLSHPLVLTGKNITADALNTSELAKIKDEMFTYEGVLTGKFGLKDKKLPAPMHLKLKKGARVMFTRNDSKERKWVNGTLGKVHSLGTNRIKVSVNGSLYTLEREKWESIKYVFNENKDKWEKQVIGSYSQFPLMLAWAITIHKSQGQTLESCLVNLEGGAFASGQTYVALSRCRSLNKLYLKQDMNLSDIRVDEEVFRFMAQIQNKELQEVG